MSETKHTPDPWIWEKAGKFACDIWSDKNKSTDGMIAVVYNEKNARLIAAAPELLEAAKHAVNVIPGDVGSSDTDQAVERLEQAIAKAEK